MSRVVGFPLIVCVYCAICDVTLNCSWFRHFSGLSCLIRVLVAGCVGAIGCCCGGWSFCFVVCGLVGFIMRTL